MNALLLTLGDGATIARRNVRKVTRVPEILVSVIVSPLIMLVLFAYVFGGSIEIEGGSYREYLVGGVFAMNLVFASVFTGAGLAEDIQKGIMDRFRSLPMSQSAVVFGRTASDVIYNVLSLAIMSVAGLLIGWRINGSVFEAITAFALLLLFAYAISWVMAYIGLLVPSPEVINQAGMMVIFPMTFVADTFAPVENFPGPLRTFAEWNPVSSVTRAARELFGNLPAGSPEPGPWSLRHPILYTLLWVAIIIGVFAPLAVRRFSRRP
ncbi:MAG: transport permease protein [Acidimicrobiales bacterium]|nr:MAG: transport permease protein [Acidimicrobiales bacterium]